MKRSLLKITFLSLSLLLLFSLSSYKAALTFNEKKSTIYPPSLAEIFYDKLELKENMPLLTNKHIDKRALKRPSVPSSLWGEIKNNVDYESFKQDVVTIIPDFYTNSELQELIDIHIEKHHIPITKVAFKNEVINLIADFGETKLLPQINTTLTNNGFEPFNN